MTVAAPTQREAAAARGKLIVALDFATPREAEALVAKLGDSVNFYKIGLELAYGGGLPYAQDLIKDGKQVFLDLKLHDIAATVSRAAQVAGLGAKFLTIHAYPQTMRAAKLGAAGSSLRLLGVTALTSYDDRDLADAGYAYGIADLVARRVVQAREAGLDGLILSAQEVGAVRARFGRDIILVTAFTAESAIRQQKRRRGRFCPRFSLRPPRIKDRIGGDRGRSVMNEMRLVVAGAAGRMGRVLVEIIRQTPGAHLVGAIEQPDSIAIGQDAGLLAGCGQMGVPISGDALATVVGADGILDFTSPQSTVGLAALAAQARIVHVIGTTGLDADHITRLEAAARHAVVVHSGNMSLGVNLLAALVERVARSLGPEYDIEIVEMHHRMKVDAPSGTALLLGEAAAKGRGVELEQHSARARDGRTGLRGIGHIGFASLRGGTVIGDHKVIFAGPGERVELAHIAEDRSIFARGAVQAALWGKNQKPGLYGMADVLGLAG